MTATSHTGRLRSLLAHACDLLERSQSGYVAGSGPDTHYHLERDALVKESRALLTDETVPK